MTNNKKTLVYIDGANPEDKRSWSGTPYNLVQQLKRNYDVETIWLQETKAEKLFRLTYNFFLAFAGQTQRSLFYHDLC